MNYKSCDACEPRCYSCHLEDRIADLEIEVNNERLKQISGFYEGEFPQYTQGSPTHELEELLTADQVNKFVTMIMEMKSEIKDLRMIASALKQLLPAITTEPHGFLTGMNNLSSRIDWYEKMRPFRDSAEKELSDYEAKKFWKSI